MLSPSTTSTVPLAKWIERQWWKVYEPSWIRWPERAIYGFLHPHKRRQEKVERHAEIMERFWNEMLHRELEELTCEAPFFECPDCGRRSYNGVDVTYQWCARCEEFKEDVPE